MDTTSEKINIYICTNGEDMNPGTFERPFATFERAKLEIQRLNLVSSSDITVFVRAGTYYLSEPFVCNTKDNISKNNRIEFVAYPGEKPVISGGKRIVGQWKHYRNEIMMCEIEEVKKGNLDFTQLFINGKRQILARYPKAGYIYPAEEKITWPHTELKYNPETFTKNTWSNPKVAVMHIFGMNYWGNLQWQVRDIDWETHTVKLGKGGFQINDIMQGQEATGIDHRSKFFIENVFEEIDSPREWYLDKETGILYVIPEKGVNLVTALIEVSVLKQVIEFRGTQEKPTRNIHFCGFRIAHTSPTFFEEYEAPSLGDWTIHRGGAVYFEGTEDCSVEKCFLDAVGGNAIFINNYNRNINISGNTITEAGDSGICIVGSKQLTIGSNYAYPSDCIVSDNLIHDIGVFGKQTAGVFISVSSGNVISHNHIYNLPRAAICINDGTWGGHIIEFNDIHDTVKETGDHGPFNSWGRERFWCLEQSHGSASHGTGDVKLDARKTVIIRNNRFEDYSGWGIDLDDGSSNYYIYNNLCIGISIKLREGDYRTIENNIFINAANPPGFHFGYEYNHDRIIRNIIVMSSKFDNPEIDTNFEKEKSEGNIYEIIGPPIRGPWLEELDYNLFYNDMGKFKATVHYRPLGNVNKDFSLKEWQKHGMDNNSIYSDPLFVDFANKDFRLKPESPAFKIGFKEFDMNSYGLIIGAYEILN